MQGNNCWSIYEFIKHLEYSDNRISWILWDGKYPLRKHFSDEEWNSIVSDISSDETLLDACQKEYLQVYLLFSHHHQQIIGFVYVLINDSRKGVVSVHGGGMKKMYNYIYPYAYIIMNEILLMGGWKVHSSCGIHNNRANQFSKRLGFITYSHDDRYFYKYVTLKQLRSTLFYKRYQKQDWNRRL